MAYRTLPSKLVGERITLDFEFMDDLQWGESISAAEVEVTVFSGVDNSPSLLIYKAAVAVNTHVTQQIQAGVPGVIYNIKCTVAGTLGTEASKVSKLAILPTNARNPPFFGIYLSTTPYPVDQIDSFAAADILTTVRLLGVFEESAYQSNLFFLDGNLYGGAVFYTADVEAYIPQNTLLDGNLYGGAKTTAIQLDSYIPNDTLLSGTLVNALVQHTQPPDSYISNVTLLSGTLT